MPDYRRFARELALRVLYQVDVGRQPAREALHGALDQLAGGVRAGLTMAAREAEAGVNRPHTGPAVFVSRTTLRERVRVRRAVVRAVSRCASGFDAALERLFADAGGAVAADGAPDHPAAPTPIQQEGVSPSLEGASWALDDAARKPMASLRRSLASAELQRDEIAEAEAIAAQALAKMHRAIDRRLDNALATARLTALLVRGAMRHREEIDERLRGLTGDWPVERQSAADRNILRLGAYEILYQPETPSAVILNEAVEIAKRYSTEESGRFVNGVLAAVAAGRAERTESVPDDEHAA